MTSGYVPMGACIISDRLIADVSGENAQDATFSNGFTYSGHPVSATAGLIITEGELNEMFDILEKEIRLATGDLTRQGAFKS